MIRPRNPPPVADTLRTWPAQNPVSSPARDHAKNICRLDITMDDAFGVRGFQSIGNLNSNLQKLRNLDGFPRDTPLECLAFEQLHGDKRAAFKFLDVINSADVRMVQRGRGARLAAEAFNGLRILRISSGRNFSATFRPSRVSTAL